jgi:N-acetylglucosaminyltransferase
MFHSSPADLLRLLPLGLVGLLSWSVWLYRRVSSHRAQPVVNDFTASTSVVVPSFREDPLVLSQCLDTWLEAGPDEVILVIDVEDVECLRMLASRNLPTCVHVLEFRHRGKRSALGVGIRAATCDIVVLVDSDTAWTPGLLQNVVMPFADPAVGGVGTRQTVAARDTSVWRRVASWMVDIRYLDYVPAMGARGAVACLSGRTAAYRRSVIAPLLPQLEYEIFLGRECVAGDDGRLTWLVLGAGFRTVHQDSARAVSMFPDTLRAFLKQRMRWSRNSYRCYVTAAWKGWLWRQPLITQITVLQILLTPITMCTAIVFTGLAFVSKPGWVAVAYLGWVVLGRGIRGFSHLREQPGDLAILPLIVVMTAVVSLPIKLAALFTMNRQGWLTRHHDQVGGDGQDSASLAEHALVA